jgi:hypothetical protein
MLCKNYYLRRIDLGKMVRGEISSASILKWMAQIKELKRQGK